MPPGSILLKAVSVACAALVLCSCVKREDYDRVMAEKTALQAQIDQRAEQLRQLQLQLIATQQQLTQIVELQTRLKDAQSKLEEKQREIDTVKEQWEKFKGDRRKAMIGRQYPELRLDDGKLLRSVQITSMIGDELALRHESGLMKVLLSKSSDDLRWEACFDPNEGKAGSRAAMLARARQLDQRLEAERGAEGATSTSPSTSTKTPSQAEAKVVRDIIAAQRKALNEAYKRIRSEHPAAMSGASWDTRHPEESGLINVFAERRAVIGIGQLDSLANAIKANLRKLHDLE